MNNIPAPELDRRQAILLKAQEAKNASLGKGPEEMAETLKAQVNLGIGGLLAMLQRDRRAIGALLVSKGVCTQLELDAAFETTALADLNAVIAPRLIYWQWVNAVDAKALACIGDPTLPVEFPAPPQLN